MNAFVPMTYSYPTLSINAMSRTSSLLLSDIASQKSVEFMSSNPGDCLRIYVPCTHALFITEFSVMTVLSLITSLYNLFGNNFSSGSRMHIFSPPFKLTIDMLNHRIKIKVLQVVF